jgi:tetratricopeptide (TPR) repeat protein
VDERHLSAAEAANAIQDWHHAAIEFMAAVHGDPAEGTGYALHQAGNALMKLRRYADAVTVYRKAACDATYEKRSSIQANLGTALATLGRHEEALAADDEALADPAYPTPYKVLAGRAAALYALGRYEEAASAFREAAWADGNPDPGKALNNLGMSFMALGKPEEAVEAFRAALGFDDYAAKGKASANLALAYSAMGFYDEAAHEFEAARDEHGYALEGETLLAYETALAKGHGAEPEVFDQAAEDVAPETVDGWETGELLPAGDRTSEAPVLPDADDEATARFFSRTEEDMKVADREARKAERKANSNPKAIVLRIVAIVLAVLVVAGGVGGALYAGYGYPTQEQTVTGLMDAYRSGQPYSSYWVAVPPTDVQQAMRALPAKFASYRIEGVNRASTTSTAVVIIRLDSGSDLAYDVQLAREGVGWKVVGIKNRWSSTSS